MDERIIHLSKYRLEKAKGDLQSAKLLLESGNYAQSINRSYYALFHTLRSLTAFDKFDSKRHSGLIAYFNQHYIKTNKFDVKLFRYISSAFIIRMKSDYDDFYIASREDAESQFRNAEDFMREIEEYIQKNYFDL